MALEPLSAQELAGAPTLFASFMGEPGTGYRTVGQLAEIYGERAGGQRPRGERTEHLRVERFAQDMADSRWQGDVVLRIGVFDENVLVVDGIHRGIAYLRCVERGISPQRLPALHVDR